MELREYTTTELLSRLHRQNGDGIAYFFDNQPYTWRDVDEDSDRIALALLAQSVTKGAHVGLLGVNTYAWIVFFFAVRKIGAVAVLLNASCQQRELQELLDFADISFLAVGEEKPRDQLDYRFMLQTLKKSAKRFPACLYMNELLEQIRDRAQSPVRWVRELEAAKSAASSRDTACILFTSGTTLRPKGVMLSEYGMLNNSAAICERMGWGGEDRMLLATPFYHCSGTTAGFLLGLHTGFSSVILRYYSSEQILRSIEGYHCTCFNVVPSMLLMLMQKKELSWYDLSSFRSGTIAGSSFTPKQYREFCEVFQLERLQPAYGQTETSPLVTLASCGDTQEQKAHTIGEALPGVQLRVWDVRNNREAGLGQPGELQVKGYCVMQGYYKQPEQTAAKFTADGWLKTGDIASRDETGRFRFEGRISEMIIRGGENISPKEIEEAISLYPGVTGVKVVGVAEDIVQEKVVALLTTDVSEFNCEKLCKKLNGQIARYKIPERFFVIPAFPMTPSGKIDQKAAAALAEKLCKETDG